MRVTFTQMVENVGNRERIEAVVLPRVAERQAEVWQEVLLARTDQQMREATLPRPTRVAWKTLGAS